MKNGNKSSIEVNSKDLIVKDKFQKIFKEGLKHISGIRELSKNEKERFRCYLALSFLSRYPKLIINLEGLIEVIGGEKTLKDARARRRRIRRWLQQQKWINREKIIFNRARKGYPYQSEELKSSIIGVRRGLEYHFMYSPNISYIQYGRPPYGYRIYPTKELSLDDQEIVKSIRNIKPFVEADSFDVIFNVDIVDSIKWISEEIIEVAGRLLWLIKDCGLGFRIPNRLKMCKVTIDDFMIGYRKIINRINNGERESVFKEMVNESMINVAVSEIGLDRTSILYRLNEDEMVITCPGCNYMKVVPGQKAPISIECELCGFIMK